MQKTKRVIKIVFWVLGLPVSGMMIYNVYRQELGISAPPLISVLPDWHWAIWLSIFLFLLVVRMIFEVYWRSSDNADLKSKNKKSPVAGRDHIGDNTYGDKLANSIKDSFNANNTNVPPKYYKPKPTELAFRIWTDISDFQAQFKSIKYTSPLRARYDKYSVTRNLLDNIIREHLPQAQFVFEESNQISNEIENLGKLVNSFGNELAYYEGQEDERQSWGRSGEKPPPMLIDQMEKTRNKLWNDGGLEFQINATVIKLLDLLRQERDK